MDRIRDQFAVSDTVTPQLVGDDSSGFAAAHAEQSLEETLCCLSIPVALQKQIHNVAVLVNCAPKIVLPALNLDEDFVNKESIAVTLVPTPKSPRILRAELDTPQPDRFVADRDTTLGHKVLDITTA